MPLKPSHPLHGLVVAAHSPFHADESLNLEAVARRPCWPRPLPNTNPTAEQTAGLRRKLETMGFFEWIAKGSTNSSQFDPAAGAGSESRSTQPGDTAKSRC